jgi:hypothetical protein
MGTDHGKKIKTPLGKPKIIDKIRKKGEKYPPDAPSPKTTPLKKKKKTPFDVMKEFDRIMKESDRLRQQSRDFGKQKESKLAKPTTPDAVKKKRAKESSNKTTITDTQKRGQVRQRYDLFEGRRLPKAPTKKNETRRSKPKNFLPHTIRESLPTVRDAVYTFPKNKKPKFLRKKTSGEA